MILDECLPRRLKTLLTNHETTTVAEAGWTGMSNGHQLAHALGRFDVFVTIDRGLVAQQDVSRLALAVVVLRAKSNRSADLQPPGPYEIRRGRLRC